MEINPVCAAMCAMAAFVAVLVVSRKVEEADVPKGIDGEDDKIASAGLCLQWGAILAFISVVLFAIFVLSGGVK